MPAVGEFSQAVTARYCAEKQNLQSHLASNLKSAMAKLVGNSDHSDLTLEANDGLKIAAHLCVLKTRAPGFYRCYVEPVLSGNGESPAEKPPEANIRIPDVDGTSLRFFLKCIYTEEDAPETPRLITNGEYSVEKDDNGGENDENSPSTANNNEIPPSGDSPAAPLQQSGDSQFSSIHTYTLEQNPPGAMMTSSELAMTSSELSDTAPPENSTSPSPATSADLSDRQDLMTSFAELATSITSNSDETAAATASDVTMETTPLVPLDSTYPTSGHLTYRKPSREENMIGKFIRLDDNMSTSVDSMHPPYPPQAPDKKIFPMFIELSGGSRDRDESASDWRLDNGSSPVGGASRVSTFSGGRKRWSVTSLRSIDSADLASPMSLHENLMDMGSIMTGANLGGACSKLGRDLLNMFLDGTDADLTVITNGQELKAHSFKESTVKFTLQFIYGSLVDVPDDVNVWELLSLADMLQLDDLKHVVYLHIRGKLCHFFHKPCAGCVTNVLECLPLLNSFGLKELLIKCCQWQAKYFSRIWKTKVFNQLNDETLALCFRAVLDSMNSENVMEILLGCEKLQMTLPKNKTGEAAAGLVACLFDTSLEFLASNFDQVLASNGFLSLGKGFALNLSLFEDLLPGVVHSLTPETGCKVLLKLYDTLTLISSQSQTGEEEWNEVCSYMQILGLNVNICYLEVRFEISLLVHPTKAYRLVPYLFDLKKFVILLKRLYELCDTHLIHYASAVVNCEKWSLLTPDMQQRIKETGIFVEIQKPRAPPPKLSSLNRTYKRSSSSGDRGVRDRNLTQHKLRGLIKPQSKENLNLSNGSLHKLDVVMDGYGNKSEPNDTLKEEEEELTKANSTEKLQPISTDSCNKDIATHPSDVPQKVLDEKPTQELSVNKTTVVAEQPQQQHVSKKSKNGANGGKPQPVGNTNIVKPVTKPPTSTHTSSHHSVQKVANGVEGRGLKQPQAKSAVLLKRSHEMEQLNQMAEHPLPRSHELDDIKSILQNDNQVLQQNDDQVHVRQDDVKTIINEQQQQQQELGQTIIDLDKTFVKPTGVSLLANGHHVEEKQKEHQQHEQQQQQQPTVTAPVVEVQQPTVKPPSVDLVSKLPHPPETVAVAKQQQQSSPVAKQRQPSPVTKQQPSPVAKQHQQQQQSPVASQQSSPVAKPQPSPAATQQQQEIASATKSPAKSAVAKKPSTTGQRLIRKDSYTKEPTLRQPLPDSSSGKPMATVAGVPQQQQQQQSTTTTTPPTTTTSTKQQLAAGQTKKPTGTARPQPQSTGSTTKLSSAVNEKKPS